MKLFRMLVLAALASVAYVAQAQVPIGPFVSATTEQFDTLAPGSYAAFPAFAGFGTFSRIGAGGAMVVTNNPALLPSISAPNAMFGRGVDVMVRLSSLRKWFGGYYRVPNAGVPVTNVKFVFYQGAVMVGVSVGGPINAFGYTWYGYDLGPLGGYDRVEIYGNASIPGYVGMDNIYVQ